MINKDIVYKIRYLPLLAKGRVHLMPSGKELSAHGNDTEWIKGVSVIPKLGGSGKTFTSKTIVNRMFSDLQALGGYGSQFKCEIVTFKLDEVSASDKSI